VLHGDKHSPLIHLRLQKSTGTWTGDDELLQKIVDQIIEREQIILTRASYAKHERFVPAPSIKILINAEHQQDDIVKVVKALQQVASTFLQ